MATAARDRIEAHVWRISAVVIVGSIMSILDTTIVNVALATLARELHSTIGEIQWVVTGYMLALGAVIPVSGWAARRFGAKRVYLVSLVLFVLGSVLCGIAGSTTELVIFRVLQGLGGGMILPIGQLMMAEAAGPERMGRVMSVVAVPAMLAPIFGPAIGGLILDNASWRWIFFINVPIGIATGSLAVRVLPADRGIGLRAGADALGALLITGALMLGVYTIVKPAAEDGWGAGTTLLLGAIAVALLVGFLVREGTARTPLIPLSIFRSRNVAGANAIQALLVAGMFSVFFLGTLYLREVLGYDALQIGLAFLPTTLVMGTLSLRYSERLMMRFGPRATLIPGLVLIAAGLGLYARVPIHGQFVTDVLPAGLLMGTGVGVSMAALMTLAMSGVTPDQAGLASGLVNTTAQVGGALGLAVLATLSSTRTHDALASGVGSHAALTAGYHLGFAIGALLVVAAIVVAVVALERAPRPAAHAADAAPALSEC
jgi:EmrB/QacA subfamily drug resistance transporter